MRGIAKAAVVLIAAGLVLGWGGKSAVRPAASDEAAPDPVMGQYEGTYAAPVGSAVRAEADVVGLGKRKYRVSLSTLPGDKSKAMRLELLGKRPISLWAFLVGKEVRLKGTAGTTQWKGICDLGKLSARPKGEKEDRFSLSRVFRVSPTEGLRPPAGAIVLLPYRKGKKTSLAQWTNKKWILLPDGSAQVSRGDNRSVRKFGDCRLHVEFWVPYEPSRRGQGRGNSGVYLQDYYEVQVLDSFGLKPKKGDCGAIYSIDPPRVNACFPPERWQTFDITFRAARFGPSGKVAKPAVMTVLHNGVLVHKDVPVPRGTEKSKPGGEPRVGPIRLQDHGHPVRYRNIWLVELHGGK